MNAYIKDLVLCSTAIVTVAILATTATPAYAQRDAGAKARGEVGTGFWNPRYRSSSFVPSRVEACRNYSYEPTATVAGCQHGASQAFPAERAAAQSLIGARSFSYDPSDRSAHGCSSPMKAPGQ